MMSGFWPHAEEMSTDDHDLKFAPICREKPKFVVSSTVETTEWNTTVVKDLAELAKINDALLLTGGAALAAALSQRGLIDEYQIFVHPVVLGGGKPILPAGRNDNLRLVESRTFDGQTVLLRYASGS